jgi:hypothetical protein
MADQEPMDGAKAGKQTAPRGRWTAQEHLRIVKASLVAGASINEDAGAAPDPVLARGHVN